MEIKQGEKLLFVGDSITDCGRDRPLGEGTGDSLGSGYVSYVDALLQSVYPDRSIRLVNKGISGNTVRDLEARWHADVVEQSPDWLVLMIGINDVWRQFSKPYQTETHIHSEEYEETIYRLINEVSGAKLVLMTPFYIEPNNQDRMRQRMDEYGKIMQDIASETNALFIDTQKAFEPLLSCLHPSAIAQDRVHPNARGHMVLAKAFLTKVGFQWS